MSAKHTMYILGIDHILTLECTQSKIYTHIHIHITNSFNAIFNALMLCVLI